MPSNDTTQPNTGTNPQTTTVDSPTPVRPDGTPSPTPPPNIDQGQRFGKA